MQLQPSSPPGSSSTGLPPRGEASLTKPWLKHYDKEVPVTLDYPEITAFRLLEESAIKHSDSPCTIFQGAEISFGEMEALSTQMAAGLAKMGVKKGDRVGILMPNTPQFVISYFGILKAGGVVVAINPLFKAREIEMMVKDAGVEVLLALSDYYETIQQVMAHSGLRKLVVSQMTDFTPTKLSSPIHPPELSAETTWFLDLLAANKDKERPAVQLSPQDPAIFQYTGGTTGLPKAAVASHYNLVANAIQLQHWIFVAEESKAPFLVAIPMFHVYGMVLGMLFPIRTANPLVIIPNPRDTKEILESIQKYKVWIFPGVPTMYNAINNHPEVKAGKYDLSTIKACISGSAPLMRETKLKFEALTGGKLFEGYGLSEAPTATHINPMYGENRTGSIGLPISDVDCKIVSLEDGRTPLPTGETGELVLRGPQVMQGYFNMPGETALTMVDGWLHTGDVARMDEEGYFYIVDRKKEAIKPGGYQVWPREVEEVIARHPKVLEVGVAGVPDAYRGETVKAWIVLKPGLSATAEEIKEYCKKELAAYKVPTLIEFVTDLPKTTVGKILRRELVRMHKESLGD